MAAAKQERITRTYAYGANGKFYSVTVTIDPRELVRDSIRKGLLTAKTRRASRANGAAKLEAVEVSQVEALRIVNEEV